ncbi:MAG: metal-dependent transcriptional regulator [Candidatus Krumholzibacteria bacterium]|nr:metal-dependent transcriptional regulator [Candidatus Krumholzibacteria bacterium]
MILSEAMQNYLKAIYEILERQDKATTSAIARRMGIAAPSVTAMVKKLARLKLVTHAPYQGVRLTTVGEKTALEVVRHHRLVELYLSEALGVPWDRVHAEAEKLEHVLSEELEERISEALGHPAFDPHGAPIPARDGSLSRVEARSLAEVPAGDRVRVVEVDDRDPELLRYLGDLALYPGKELEVLRVEPYNGPFVVRVDGRERIVGRAAAQEILVTA